MRWPQRRLGPGMSPIGAAVLAGALLLTAVAAWWLRTRDGAVRVPAGGRDDVDGPLAVLARLGVRPEELTALVDAHVGAPS